MITDRYSSRLRGSIEKADLNAVSPQWFLGNTYFSAPPFTILIDCAAHLWLLDQYHSSSVLVALAG